MILLPSRLMIFCLRIFSPIEFHSFSNPTKKARDPQVENSCIPFLEKLWNSTERIGCYLFISSTSFVSHCPMCSGVSSNCRLNWDTFSQVKKEESVFATGCVLLAYRVDMFGRLNELNLNLHGKHKTIIYFIDILSAFHAKLELWKRKMEMSKTGMLPVHPELLEDTKDLKLDDTGDEIN